MKLALLGKDFVSFMISNSDIFSFNSGSAFDLEDQNCNHIKKRLLSVQ